MSMSLLFLVSLLFQPNGLRSKYETRPKQQRIEKNHKQTIARRREILKGLRIWYILLLFVSLYLLVLLVYSVSLKAFWGAIFWRF